MAILVGFVMGWTDKLRKRQLSVLGTAGRNGHQRKKPWRWQVCGSSNNTFRGGRPPLGHIFPIGPYMNYALGQKRFRDPEDP